MSNTRIQASVFLLLLFLCVSPSHGYNGGCKLVVKVKNLQIAKDSKLYVALHKENNKGFPEAHNAYLRQIIDIHSAEQSITFDNLEVGTYAVSVFQDLNDNQKIDTDLFGVPKEPFGLSGHKKTFHRRPQFNECSFKVEDTQQQIDVVVQSFKRNNKT